MGLHGANPALGLDATPQLPAGPVALGSYDCLGEQGLCFSPASLCLLEESTRDGLPQIQGAERIQAGGDAPDTTSREV